MDTVAPRLPSALGSTAALSVAAISFFAQVPPHVCALRAMAAFAVFSAFGIVIRYLLADNAGLPRSIAGSVHPSRNEELITPGATVEELLASDEHS
jgi:hypothetical protein